ncbi:4Fe-4S dicluster domain-containing protein [Acidobacteriota bacterium]
MEKILKKTDFPKWLKKLKSYQIYAPVLKDSHWSYEEVEKVEAITLDHLNTILSPKKILLPQREVFFEFNSGNGGKPEMNEVLPEDFQAVIFGVRPCDGKAITLHDMVFGGDYTDVYYWKRRNQTTIVGLACNNPPFPTCFCTTVDGSPHSKNGLDILMTDLGEGYHVESLTKKGDALLQAAKDVFSAPKEQDKKAREGLENEAVKKIRRQVKDIKKVPPKLKDMFDVDLWDDESLSCISCGICTYLCPTCHCFDINDEVQSGSPLKGKRVRTWDNCQFPDFTMHSSGHNPRPDRASRLRQRLMHKFQYFVTIYDNYQCTGCGRCIGKCPVGIDILDVIEKVRDYGS